MNNWEKFEKNLAELKANPDMDKVDILLEEINIYRFELEAQNEELKRTNMILMNLSVNTKIYLILFQYQIF